MHVHLLGSYLSHVLILLVTCTACGRTQGKSFWNRLRCRGERVESIPYYEEELNLLNQKITNLQIAIRQANDAINQKEEERQESIRLQQHQQHHLHMASNNSTMASNHDGSARAAAGMHVVGGPGPRRLSVSPFLMGDAESRAHIMATAPAIAQLEGTIHVGAGGQPVTLDDEAGEPELTFPTSIHLPHLHGGSSSSKKKAGREMSSPSTTAAGPTNGSIGAAAAAATTNTTGTTSPSDHVEAIVSADHDSDDDSGNTSTIRCQPPKQSICSFLRSITLDFLRFGKNTGKIAVSAGQEVTRAMTLLALDTSMSSTGFVTFKSMSSAAIAAQSLLTMEPFMFTIRPAPEPRDIAFSNVSTPLRLIEWREATTTMLIVFLSVFWGGLVSGLYKMQSWMQKQVDDEPALQDLGYWGRFLLYLGIDYVPTLLLLIIVSLLPLFFWWSSLYYEKMRTYSDMDASVMSRYFYYQMVNIYATSKSNSKFLLSLSDLSMMFPLVLLNPSFPIDQFLLSLVFVQTSHHSRGRCSPG